MGDVILSMRGIGKRFGAVQALNNVDLIVHRGTVHALIGENGAGKSTLMKVLSGGIRPDAGSIEFDGGTYRATGPAEARTRGIGMIYQELTLAPHLTVLENITLGAEQHRFGVVTGQHERTREALSLLGHSDLELSARVGALGVGRQQVVEIARTLFLNARLVIMDEPTSSLSREDTRALFAAVRRLSEQGVTIIYISHFLEEVKELCDEFTVLRDGASIATGKTEAVSLGELVTHMVGRTLDEMFPRIPHDIGALALEVAGLCRPPRVRSVSFTLRRGEILGIAGLVGAGRTEMLRALFGLDSACSAAVKREGRALRLGARHSPRVSLKAGMCMVSENRKDEGLATGLPIRENVSLASVNRYAVAGIIDTAGEDADITRHVASLALKYENLSDPCTSLSGGNQQKVVLARVLATGSDVLLLDEPTRGIDVKSKVEIYTLIGRLARDGKAVVMVSSYLPELFGVCDSLAVMYRGELSPAKPPAEWSEESVMAWATTGKYG